MRWSKGLWVGLSGTSLALAVGCSHGDAKPDATDAAETTAAESRSTQGYEADATAKAKPGWSKDGDAAKEAEQVRPSSNSTFADAQSGTQNGSTSPWFLRPPGSPDPNAPPQVTTVSETPKPVVGVAQPIARPRPNPPPPPGGWRRAACGRG